MSKGVDINEYDRNYYTPPLCVAAESGHLEICKLLLTEGANINVQSRVGETALHKAIRQNDKKEKSQHFEIVKYLIEKGANVNMPNNNKDTPLHITKSKDVAKLLLKNGAKTDVKNNQGKNPKDLSKKNKAHDVTKVITEHESENVARQNGQVYCIICYEPKYGAYAFLPCGHAKTCETCCKSITHPSNSNPKCPCCHQPVTMYQKIFI